MLAVTWNQRFLQAPRSCTGVLARIPTFSRVRHFHMHQWLIRAVVAITAFAKGLNVPDAG
jgi:hypothetical protein